MDSQQPDIAPGDSALLGQTPRLSDERHHASAPPAERVGSFRFLIAGESWEWSDEVARMYGYQPGTVVPTTELVLSHKHSDDKPTVAALIVNAIREGQPFSSRHRIIDTYGRIHLVVVVGDRLVDDAGQVIGTAGFYIDITEDYENDVRDRVRTATTEPTAGRAVIEQARGILMYVYNLPDNRALDLLKWRSRQTKTNLPDLCQRFVRNVTRRDMAPDLLRREVEHVLRTAHRQMAGG